MPLSEAEVLARARVCYRQAFGRAAGQGWLLRAYLPYKVRLGQEEFLFWPGRAEGGDRLVRVGTVKQGSVSEALEEG